MQLWSCCISYWRIGHIFYSCL